MIVDRLSLLVWSKTKDAQEGRNRPLLITDKLLGNEDQKTVGFDSIEEFERERRRILGGG